MSLFGVPFHVSSSAPGSKVKQQKKHLQAGMERISTLLAAAILRIIVQKKRLPASVCGHALCVSRFFGLVNFFFNKKQMPPESCKTANLIFVFNNKQTPPERFKTANLMAPVQEFRPIHNRHTKPPARTNPTRPRQHVKEHTRARTVCFALFRFSEFCFSI